MPPRDDEIFVFGSNLAGRHGAGAARHAREHFGAIYGQGIGLQGRSYGIPTKDNKVKTLPLSDVRKHVATFLVFAAAHPELRFYVTPVGCGLAGFRRSQIEPLFAGMPENCRFAESWDEHRD